MPQTELISYSVLNTVVTLPCVFHTQEAISSSSGLFPQLRGKWFELLGPVDLGKRNPLQSVSKGQSQVTAGSFSDVLYSSLGELSFTKSAVYLMTWAV